MRFQHIEYLVGLFSIPFLVLLFSWLLRWKKKVVNRIGDPALISQLVRNFSSRLFLVKFVLVLLAFAALIAGLANLQSRGGEENVARKGVDVMLVLDVSKSMLAEDVKPSRLDKAKQFLVRLLDNMPNDRVGLVLFAGRAYMQMPLTIDNGAAKMYIQEASPLIVPTQGTVFAEALRMASGAFNKKEHKYKAIVMVTDGEDHDPDALAVAKQLADDGVMINTVGIGSPEGSTLIDPVTHEIKKDMSGHVVVSKLNEDLLSQMANLTNGSYIRLGNIDDALITLSQRLDSIEKRSLNDSEFVSYRSYFQWFLAAALLFLIIEFFLPERKWNIA
jgi:Ca-activated chloride channel family protein